MGILYVIITQSIGVYLKQANTDTLFSIYNINYKNIYSII